MKETPGQLLVRLLNEVMAGSDPAELNKEIKKALGSRIKDYGIVN